MGRTHKQACKQLNELKEELEEKYKIQIDRNIAPDSEEIEIKIQRNKEREAIIEEAESKVQETIPGSREETWARNKLKEAAISLLNEDQKEKLEEAKKNVDKAKGAQKQQKTQRELRIVEIELGITRQTREETERPKKKIVHTEAQKEEAKEAEQEIKKAEQTNDERKIMQAEQKFEYLLTSYLNQEQKEKLRKATDLFNHTDGVSQLEARNNLRKMRVELGLIKEGKIITMRRETRASKTKEIKKISDRLVERAMKKLGEALRKMSDEPVNEVIRGEEEYWKLPCQVYHIPCRQGKPRHNWMISVAADVWEHHKLYKKLNGGNNTIPEEFDYRKKTHMKIILKEAVEGTF